MLNSKKMKLVQNIKNGKCHAHGFRCVKNHSSEAYSNPGPNHKRMRLEMMSKEDRLRTRIGSVLVMKRRYSGYPMNAIDY